MDKGFDLSDEQYRGAFAAFERSVEVAGGQVPFANVCRCTQGNISQLLQKKSLLPVRFVLKVEANFGVPRHLLRPDVYPLGLTEGVPFYPAAENLGDCAPVVACDRSAILQPGTRA
jgi:DNA-binding transcriptional regulator YdaS (Cro superfamily)